ncbi:MAG: hypothetical protein U0470_04675 [Anaerolineae bacterium]
MRTASPKLFPPSTHARTAVVTSNSTNVCGCGSASPSLGPVAGSAFGSMPTPSQGAVIAYTELRAPWFGSTDVAERAYSRSRAAWTFTPAARTGGSSKWTRAVHVPTASCRPVTRSTSSSCGTAGARRSGGCRSTNAHVSASAGTMSRSPAARDGAAGATTAMPVARSAAPRARRVGATRG